MKMMMKMRNKNSSFFYVFKLLITNNVLNFLNSSALLGNTKQFSDNNCLALFLPERTIILFSVNFITFPISIIPVP